MEYVFAQDRRTDVFGTDHNYAREKHVNNYGNVASNSFVKCCISRQYELAFVVRCNRQQMAPELDRCCSQDKCLHIANGVKRQIHSQLNGAILLCDVIPDGKTE